MTPPLPSKTEVYERLKQVLVDNMAVALEARTGRKLKEEDLESIRTMQDVVEVVHQHLST